MTPHLTIMPRNVHYVVEYVSTLIWHLACYYFVCIWLLCSIITVPLMILLRHASAGSEGIVHVQLKVPRSRCYDLGYNLDSGRKPEHRSDSIIPNKEITMYPPGSRRSRSTSSTKSSTWNHDGPLPPLMIDLGFAAPPLNRPQ